MPWQCVCVAMGRSGCDRPQKIRRRRLRSPHRKPRPPRMLLSIYTICISSRWAWTATLAMWRRRRARWSWNVRATINVRLATRTISRRTSRRRSACNATRCFRQPVPKISCRSRAIRVEQPIVFDFSHARHVDPHTRVDARTGFRADCTFCHHFQGDGAYASFGNHLVCAGCHSKAGMKPLLSEKSTTADCRGCHRPEEIENPSVATVHRQLASFVISGKYPQIQFSHAEHFKNRDAYHLDCTTCHYGIAESTI